MNKFFIFILFISFSANSFMPKTFKAEFEQSFISSVTNKEKKSYGEIFYQNPSKIRFEVKTPDNTIFTSDGITSWYYTAPFDPKEKGEVIIRPTNKLPILKFFDALKLGLTSNQIYKVNKKSNIVEVTFLDKYKNDFKIEKAKLEFVSNSYNFNSLKKLYLNFTDKKEVTFIFSSVYLDIKFQDNLFVFEIPKNTKISED